MSDLYQAKPQYCKAAQFTSETSVDELIEWIADNAEERVDVYKGTHLEANIIVIDCGSEPQYISSASNHWIVIPSIALRLPYVMSDRAFKRKYEMTSE